VVTLAETLMMMMMTMMTEVTVGNRTQTVVDPVGAVAFRSDDQVVVDPEDLEDQEVVAQVETPKMDLTRNPLAVWKE
jgi:hypothetical protein